MEGAPGLGSGDVWYVTCEKGSVAGKRRVMQRDRFRAGARFNQAKNGATGGISDDARLSCGLTENVATRRSGDRIAGPVKVWWAG